MLYLLRLHCHVDPSEIIIINQVGIELLKTDAVLPIMSMGSKHPPWRAKRRVILSSWQHYFVYKARSTLTQGSLFVPKT